MVVSPSRKARSDTCRTEGPMPGGRPQSRAAVVDQLGRMVINDTAHHAEEILG